LRKRRACHRVRRAAKASRGDGRRERREETSRLTTRAQRRPPPSPPAEKRGSNDPAPILALEAFLAYATVAPLLLFLRARRLFCIFDASHDTLSDICVPAGAKPKRYLIPLAVASTHQGRQRFFVSLDPATSDGKGNAYAGAWLRQVVLSANRLSVLCLRKTRGRRLPVRSTSRSNSSARPRSLWSSRRWRGWRDRARRVALTRCRHLRVAALALFSWSGTRERAAAHTVSALRLADLIRGS